jgi:hypothetical protein
LGLIGGPPPIVRWDEPNVPMLAISLIVLVFALAGVRARLPLPTALSANWIFRITMIQRPAEYFEAVRRSLYLLTVAPVWIVSLLVYCALWPLETALQHLAVLFVVGVLLVECSLYGFQKIPFSCSYLPGKANLNVKLGVYALLFLILADRGVVLELWGMESFMRFSVLFAVLLGAAAWARRRASQYAASAHYRIQFEDLPIAAVSPLDLTSDQAPFTRPLSTDEVQTTSGATPREKRLKRNYSSTYGWPP